jgi:hypothetical protein
VKAGDVGKEKAIGIGVAKADGWGIENRKRETGVADRRLLIVRPPELSYLCSWNNLEEG